MTATVEKKTEREELEDRLRDIQWRAEAIANEIDSLADKVSGPSKAEIAKRDAGMRAQVLGLCRRFCTCGELPRFHPLACPACLVRHEIEASA